jgi:hypothetical protein
MGKIRLRKFVFISGVFVMLAGLSACSVGGFPIRMKSIEKPHGGYKAIQFTEFTTVKDHAINVYAFGAGTILVNDREIDGVPFYCGQLTINSGVMEGCFVFEGDTVVIGYGASFKEVRRDLTGKIKHIKINP